MESTNSPKEKPGISGQVRLLTPSETESLLRDMRESSAWMRAELKRQREQKEARGTILAEQRHRRGYEQHPVGMDEFSVWENEQVWGDE